MYVCIYYLNLFYLVYFIYLQNIDVLYIVLPTTQRYFLVEIALAVRGVFRWRHHRLDQGAEAALQAALEGRRADVERNVDGSSRSLWFILVNNGEYYGLYWLIMVSTMVYIG